MSYHVAPGFNPGAGRFDFLSLSDSQLSGKILFEHHLRLIRLTLTFTRLSCQAELFHHKDSSLRIFFNIVKIKIYVKFFYHGTNDEYFYNGINDAYNRICQFNFGDRDFDK